MGYLSPFFFLQSNFSIFLPHLNSIPSAATELCKPPYPSHEKARKYSILKINRKTNAPSRTPMSKQSLDSLAVWARHATKGRSVVTQRKGEALRDHQRGCEGDNKGLEVQEGINRLHQTHPATNNRNSWTDLCHSFSFRWRKITNPCTLWVAMVVDPEETKIKRN